MFYEIKENSKHLTKSKPLHFTMGLMEPVKPTLMPWAEFKPSSSGYKDQQRRNLNILLMSIK
jgi:hypothetical protein